MLALLCRRPAKIIIRLEKRRRRKDRASLSRSIYCVFSPQSNAAVFRGDDDEVNVGKLQPY
jgi:hypothetical protein